MDDHFVDVWIIPLNGRLPETLSLSADEWARAERMLPAPRRIFIASHEGMRRILAGYLETAPEQIAFEVDAYHKPSLKGAPSLSFNLSHSEEIALLAVTRGRQIGVDLERVRSISEMDLLAETYFTGEEYRQWARLPTETQTEAFFRVWTRKEALLKALGQGLHIPLNRFRVPLETSAMNQKLAVVNNGSGAPLGWSLFAFEPAPDYVGAVVVEGQVDVPPVLRFYSEGL